jgi:cyanophycin synthetase
MTAEVAFSGVDEFRTSQLRPALRSALDEALPGVLDGPEDALELTAALAGRIDRAGDLAAPLHGIGKRESEMAVLFFSSMDPRVGEHAAAAAVRLVDALTRSAVTAAALTKGLETVLEQVKQQLGLYVTTRGMLAAAERRNIPWVRTTALSKHATLGQGCRQHHVIDTVVGVESAIGRDLSRDKALHLDLLSKIGLPVGKIATFSSVASGLAAAKLIGFPLVLKPVGGHKGQQVFVGLDTPQELERVLRTLPLAPKQRFLLQSYFPGTDHRMLVVNGKLVAVAVRVPASVVGDGRQSIVALAEAENRNPLRRHGPMQDIILDDEADRVLAQQGLTRDSVPPAGLRVMTRGTANISTGGSSLDVTDRVHPDNARVAVRAARALGITAAGVDFICPDIARSWHETGGGICEVNTHVGLRPHVLSNAEHDVNGIILESIFPPGDDGRIPTAMVTGSMGKTTVSSMLASVLTSAGHTVGLVTTDGVRVGGEMVIEGDVAGPNGHAVALRDPLTTAAVLETARGGMLKKGIYLDVCDVAALINVAREHVGTDGIETVEDMALLKRKVLEGARSAVVLNAEDAQCLLLAEDFAPRIRTILFARDGRTEPMRAHLARGQEALFLSTEDGNPWIVAAKGGQTTRLVKLAELPSTAGGFFWQQGLNAMAAAGLAMALGIAPDAIASGLLRYGREYPAAAGRLQFADGFPVPFVLDFAAYAPGFAHVGALCAALPVKGRRICAVTLPGNRADYQYPESAAALASYFQRFICFERDDLRRGMPKGEIARRLKEALEEAGVASDAISIVGDLHDAGALLAREAQAEDLVVFFTANPHTPVDEFRAAFTSTTTGSARR